MECGSEIAAPIGSIASLPMYDLPELRAATDAWWTGLARALRRAGLSGVPQRLARDGVFGAEWSDERLLLSQCCGWDLTHDRTDSLQPVATPVYAVEGCIGPYYRSLIVVRTGDPAVRLDELRGRVCAVNMSGSQSGCNTLRYSLARLARSGRFFRRVVETGAHAASLEAVRGGWADLAAIDCVTFTLLRAHRPASTAGLRVLARSRRAPALPYVTRAGVGPERLRVLRTGLMAALEEPALAEARATLRLAGFRILPASAYGYILSQERRAQALGYAHLR